MESGGERREERYDAVLVAVGRAPNSQDLGLEQTRVRTDALGYIQVDGRQRTADPSVSAIGDVVGAPLLAHKAAKEAKIAVDAILGRAHGAEKIVMPAVVFTDPELAWCGLTETQARQQGRRIRVARFPWSASGRAMSIDKPSGMTKLILDEKTERVLGVAIVGSGAGELISEGVVAMELGATARDLAESVHPHPTLSETIKECAELFYGNALHAFSRSPV
jgi:dihydrolipoamide dehydrogenase